LLIDEEKHPAGVCDPKKDKVTPLTASGARVREALLRLLGRNVVAEQKLLFIVLVPFELGQVMAGSSARTHTSSVQCATACTAGCLRWHLTRAMIPYISGIYTSRSARSFPPDEA
jgi:hypothetical protein